MTRVVVAPAPFKGTLSASRAASIIGDALRDRGAVVDECPLPDGGEGTLAALAAAWGLRVTPFAVVSGIGQTTDAVTHVDVAIGTHDGRSIAVIESALVIGLMMLPPARRDGRASSAPLGHLLAQVMPRVDHVLLALGGTAVVDGGRGLLDALAGRPVSVTGLVDVQAPLRGPDGARLYFGQKGLPAARFDEVEADLCALHPAFVDVAGAGAAGGLGAAVLALGGSLRSGAETVIAAAQLEARIAAADVVVAGEGRVDVQTRQGKSLWHVKRLAERHHKRFVVVCGSCELATWAETGVDGSHEAGAVDLIALGPAGLADPTRALRAAAGRIRL